jgi:hypothetical protein
MVRSTAFASLAILASFAAAPLAAYAEAGNIVGGGGATIAGGSDDMRISYNISGAGGGRGVLAQVGRLARFVGSDGDGQQVEYLTPAPAGAGRKVWLIGGGGDAEVVADQNR